MYATAVWSSVQPPNSSIFITGKIKCSWRLGSKRFLEWKARLKRRVQRTRDLLRERAYGNEPVRARKFKTRWNTPSTRYAHATWIHYRRAQRNYTAPATSQIIAKYFFGDQLTFLNRILMRQKRLIFSYRNQMWKKRSIQGASKRVSTTWALSYLLSKLDTLIPEMRGRCLFVDTKLSKLTNW